MSLESQRPDLRGRPRVTRPKFVARGHLTWASTFLIKQFGRGGKTIVFGQPSQTADLGHCGALRTLGSRLDEYLKASPELAHWLTRWQADDAKA